MRRVTAPTRSSRRSLRRSRGSACSSAHAGARSPLRIAPSGKRPRGRRILRRQRDLGAGRPRAARRKPRRSRGRIRLRAAAAADAAGTNREGTYWRYEMKLRDAESRLGSITGGNGSIYAVNRADYIEVDPRWGHDLSFPYRMVQEGRRAVYEPMRMPSRSRLRRTRPSTGARCGCSSTAGRSRCAARCSAACPRLLRRDRLAPVAPLRQRDPASHAARLEPRAGRDGWAYGIVLAGQVALIAAAAAGVPIARYYVLVTWATVVALWNYLRRGVPATWEAAEGTR